MSAERKAKDKSMAAYLKTHKVKRTQQRCPINHNHMVGLEGAFVNHLNVCR